MRAAPPESSGYQRLPTWVLGFHGCDESIARAVLGDPTQHLEPSLNKWDWLGSGIYFWENDPARAMQFALEGMDGKVTRGRIRQPFVIGAVIDLALCCNLFDQAALREMQTAFIEWRKLFLGFGIALPKNKGKGRFRVPK